MRAPAKIIAMLVLVVALCCGFALSAQASLLDFQMKVPTTGEVTYGTGTDQGVIGDAPLQGINLQLDAVLGLGTPFHNRESLPITNGLLTFVTGDYAGNAGRKWNFSGGGTISLTGAVDFGSGDVTETLFSGTVDSAKIYSLGRSKLIGASVHVTKAPELIDYFYGDTISPDTIFEGMIYLSFYSTAVAGQHFSSTTLYGGALLDTPGAVPDPPGAALPPSLLLLGTGLLGIAGIRLGRRMKR